ncbi:MAG: glycoside hydrolase family 13 protein [Pirellulaceae bacterium]
MSKLDGPAKVRRPAWVEDAVFYQIFPDRFARSDRVLKPTNLLSWGSPPTEQGYHGGDLEGIRERLDYLVELGINAIYLTPIFQSACNHRYHTHDYYQVDPLLGGNSALRNLIEAAHARGIRIMLDGVFNHASRGFFQFHDILENGPHSAWLDWFFIEGWPLTAYDGARPANYMGWVNNRALPKFNTANPAVREFLMQVGEFWIREFDIDGWRLDVPTEIKTAGFWEEFRSRTRAIKSDLYLVGEIWHEAADWLRGDRFDATMNYVFSAAVIAFAGGDRVSQALVSNRSYEPYPGIDARTFAERIAKLHATYDWDTTLVQLNLLASHDAPRVIDIARGDKATLRLATLLQMTFPGAPCVYYGDEIGLRGTKRYDRPHRDLDARWPFPWQDEARWDREMLHYFRTVIALRRTHSALRNGEFLPLHAEGTQYAFLRHNASQTLLVAFNMAEHADELLVHVRPHLADNQRLVARFGPPLVPSVADGRVRLVVPPRTGLVLEASKNSTADSSEP